MNSKWVWIYRLDKFKISTDRLHLPTISGPEIKLQFPGISTPETQNLHLPTVPRVGKQNLHLPAIPKVGKQKLNRTTILQVGKKTLLRPEDFKTEIKLSDETQIIGQRQILTVTYLFRTGQPLKSILIYQEGFFVNSELEHINTSTKTSACYLII